MKPLLSIKELEQITREKYHVLYNLVTKHRIAGARRLGGVHGPWRVSSDAARALFPEAFAAFEAASYPAPPEGDPRTIDRHAMVSAGAGA